jgi:thioredoxin-related protein
MKFILKLVSVGLLIAGLVFVSSFSHVAEETEKEGIHWYSWEEAVKLCESNPKKLLVDVYTDWCGWCKKMDKETFTNSEIIELVNADFYAVKLDAEQKEDILYKEFTLKFKPEYGRRGAHELAVSLLDGKMGYPSLVFLDEKQNRITISPGYKVVEGLKQELEYIAGGHYAAMTFDEFKAK